MTEKHLIGVDIGTQGTKAVLFSQSGNCLSNHFKSSKLPAGYAVMRLCGLSGDDAFIDKSHLHFSGFADNRNNAWDAELCRRDL